MPAKVFISYSHADEALRDRLATHLAPMQREGLIEPWHDRRLLPGDAFDQVIDANLEAADLILFLVSADFLASRYCYEIEAKRALERHQAGEAKAVSIILDHCDWLNTPLKDFVALPNDGVPVVKHPNHNEAFHQISQELRRLLSAMKIQPTQTAVSPSDSSNPVTAPTLPRSGNLGIKKEFRDNDQGRFLNESFVYIRNFFEGSLNELKARNSEIDVEFRELDADRFTARIYRGGKEASSCSILRTEGGMAGKWGIMYQSGTQAARNTMEGSLAVADDGHDLGFDSRMFEQFGMSMGRHRDNEGLLSQQGAAEALWNRLIEPLQR